MVKQLRESNAKRKGKILVAKETIVFIVTYECLHGFLLIIYKIST